MEQKPQYPVYNFINNLPEDLMDHHPLAASLQTFETSLMLLSLCRIPAALVMCGSAIESVQKAILQTEESEDIKAGALFKMVKGHYGKKRSDWDDLWIPYNKFFRKRNGVIHFGYTPESTDDCARHLLGAGFPILSNLYEALFDIHLTKNSRSQKALFFVPNLATIWDATKRIYKAAIDNNEPYVAHTLLPLCKYISFFMHDDGDDGSNNYGEYSYNKSRMLREKLESDFTYAHEFKCPICEWDEFIVSLSHDGLDNEVIVIDEGSCAHCDFVVNYEQRLLLDILMEGQVKEKSAALLNGYGIK
jgi:hypothetical protein